MTKPATLSRAAEHLAAYLGMRPGALLVAYEASYQGVVDALVDVLRSSGEVVELLVVESVDPADLRARLLAAEKFLCAFNRRFATGVSEHVTVMVECGVDAAERAYTLSDISSDFTEVFQADPEEIAGATPRSSGFSKREEFSRCGTPVARTFAWSSTSSMSGSTRTATPRPTTP
jgi:hypothetical protein